jgi:hypothetical protein
MRPTEKDDKMNTMMIPTPADFDESLADLVEGTGDEEGMEIESLQLGLAVATEFKATRSVPIPLLRLSQFKGVCQYVHALSDAMFDIQGTSGLRTDVIRAAAVEGVAYFTVRTQYNHWFEAKFFPGRVAARNAAKAAAKAERAEQRAVARAQKKAKA